MIIIFLAEERNRSLRERLELQEKRWTNHMTEQKNKNSASSKDKSARENEERLNNLQMEISDKNEEISSLRARESQNEEYSSRLARKLDRIMAENHNRTQKELRKLLEFNSIIILFIVLKKSFVTLVTNSLFSS